MVPAGDLFFRKEIAVQWFRVQNLIDKEKDFNKLGAINVAV